MMTAKAIVRRHKEKKYRIAVAYYLTYIIQIKSDLRKDKMCVMFRKRQRKQQKMFECSLTLDLANEDFKETVQIMRVLEKSCAKCTLSLPSISPTYF